MRDGYEAVIFDFDYTLADSSRGAVECINYALRCLGLPVAPPEAIYRTIGLSLAETLTALAGRAEAGRSEEFARLFKRRADEVMIDATVLFENVPLAIRRMREGSLKLGIVSTKFRYRIESVLIRDGLLDAFDVIVGGEDVARHKPDPEGLLKAAEKLGCPTSRALYVGDSVTDAETAQRCGFPFAAVLSGVTRREEFAGYPAVRVLGDVSALADWLLA
jgi:phosphoglycolate phosphatase